MTTTNIKYGSNVTALSGHPNVRLKGSVLARLSIEGVITQAAVVKMNAQKRVGDLTTGLSISGLVRMTSVPVGLVPPILPQSMSIAICQGKRPFSGDLQCLQVLLFEYRHRLLCLSIITYRARRPISAVLPWPREATARPRSLHLLPLSVNRHQAAPMMRNASLDCHRIFRRLFPRTVTKQEKRRIYVG
jgi:hypothetical protein